MAFLYLKFNRAFVMLLFCSLVVMEEASAGCNNGYWCFHAKEASHHEIQNRKVLAGGMEKEKKEGFFVGVHMQEASSGNEGPEVVGWELRKVPSGPDPLHHNGHGPKKPQTP